MKMDSKLFLFGKSRLDRKDCEMFRNTGMRLRSDILELIATSGSGHIGGSYSTIDALLVTYLCANLSPENADDQNRDRVVVSHGHISAGIYSLLAAMGYFSRSDLLREYRRVPGVYEGHPSIAAKGIDWGSGSLGQGLSVGCGMALAAKMQGRTSHTFVFMGDGENDKGQITEALALASKYRLGGLTAFVDANGIQCTGNTDCVLSMNLAARYRAYGWRVFEVDGHDYAALYDAFRQAYTADIPCVILGKTVMGKGISFIENDYRYHGGFLNEAQLREARALFAPYKEFEFPEIDKPVADIPRTVMACRNPLGRIVYTEPIACRKALGAALVDYAAQLPEKEKPVVIDCDVAPSSGMESYVKANPERIVQCGIAEQNAVSVAGGMSVSGIPTILSTFAMFALGEPFGQLRSNTMNHAPFKVLTTHCGLDVGPDGKTHQCIDYIGLAANLYHFKMIIPADGNQTDLAARYCVASPDSCCVAVGRSSVPVIHRENGSIFYGEDYSFRYGEADWIRSGTDATVISYGTLLGTALIAVENLKEKGVDCGLMNVSCPLRLDEAKLREAAKTGWVFVFEDHNARTGLGAQIALFFAQNGLNPTLRCMGLNDYGGSAKSTDLYHIYNLDACALEQAVETCFTEKKG